jgi:hypothetical protein
VNSQVESEDISSISFSSFDLLDEVSGFEGVNLTSEYGHTCVPTGAKILELDDTICLIPRVETSCDYKSSRGSDHELIRRHQAQLFLKVHTPRINVCDKPWWSSLFLEVINSQNDVNITRNALSWKFILSCLQCVSCLN